MLLHLFLLAYVTSYAIGTIPDIIPGSVIPENYSNLTSCLRILHKLHLSRWNEVILAIDSRYDTFYYSNEYLKEIGGIMSIFHYNFLMNQESLYEKYKNVQNVAVVVLTGQGMNSDLFSLIDMFRNRQIYLCFVYLNGASEKKYSKVLEYSVKANLHETIAVINEKEVFIAKSSMQMLENCEFKFILKSKPWDSFSSMEIYNLMKNHQEFNYHKCPVNVSTTLVEPFVMYENSTEKLSGMEVRLVQTIADVLNFTANFMVRSHWGIMKMGKIIKSGLQTDVLDGTSEIGFATMWLDPGKIHIFDTTSVYFEDCLTWSVPPFSSRKTFAEKTMEVLMKGFEPWVWLFFLLSILTIPFVLTAYYRLYKTREDTFSVFTIGFLIAVSLALQKSIPRKFIVTKGSISFLFIAWYMYTMIMNTIYCGFLSSNLLVNKPKSSVKNIREIIEAKMSVAISPGIFHSLMQVDDEDYEKLKRSGIDKTKTVDCLYNISDGAWLAFSRNKASLLYYKDKIWRERKRSVKIFNVLDNCYMNCPVVLILR